MRGRLLAFRRVEGAPADMSDAALLAACAVGDRSALGALFDRYHGHVHRFLGRMSGTDVRDLDDLVQTTFLQIQRSAAAFRGRASVRSWIFGVAANVVRHHVRAEVRRRNLAAGLVLESVPGGASPDDAILERQLVAQIMEAQQRLPHELRVVFVMCDLENVSGAEAAKILGLREGTLWRRLHEARRTLRTALERRMQ